MYVKLTPLPLFAFQLLWGKLGLVMAQNVLFSYLPLRVPVPILGNLWKKTSFISRIDVTVPKSSCGNPTVYRSATAKKV
jgi:hypothetical protein